MFGRTLSGCLLLLVASTSSAGAIYKFVDANGVVTYTDKKTPGARVFNLQELKMERVMEKSMDKQVRLETKKHPAGETLIVHNDLFAPVEVELKLTGLVNVSGAPDKPISWVVPPRSQIRLASLAPRITGQAMRYTPGFTYALGDPRLLAKPYAYPHPWLGGPFRMTQGPNGNFSHNTPKGRYAVDIGMPEGTPILAARAGVVVKIENDQVGRGTNPAGNFVRIMHDDGTMGVYLHLMHASVNVREGQHVAVGEQIARSGNTGHSTGAHLHFVVQRNVGLAVESIPFDFNRPVDSSTAYAIGSE